MTTFGGAGHGPVGRCGWARAGVGVEMPVVGAKGSAAQATTHGVNDRFVLPICTFRVVAVPGCAAISVVDFVFGAEGRPAGAAESLVLDGDRPATRVVTNELTWASSDA